MRAISIKCPNCHANLEAGETAHKVVCTYCGTHARVQHRTRFLERKIQLPPSRPAERKLPVAKQRHGMRWLALVTTIIPLLFGAGVFFFVMKQVGGIEKVTNALSEVRESLDSNEPALADRWKYGGKGNALFHDINGDGHLDIVGSTRYVQRDDSYHLAAFDGTLGTKLWESESFGNHSDAIAGLTILQSETIVQSDSRGNIAGYGVATGERLWKVPLGEKLTEACADDEVSLALNLKDKSWKRILMKDGSLSQLEEAPEDCRRIAIQRKFGQAHLTHASQNRRRRRPRGKLDGMQIRDLVTLVGEAGHQVALGYKSPGTRIPMLAYLRVEVPAVEEEGEEDSKTKRRKARKRQKSRKPPKPQLAWTSELPALDPLATREGAPELVAVSAGYIASIYEPKSGPPHVVCFSREGGQRLWDVALPGRSSSITAIDLAGSRVYVTQWGRLDAFEVEKGAPVFSLGQ